MKIEVELARERRDRVARFAGATPSARARYQFYKERLSGERTSSLSRLRQLGRSDSTG